MSVKIKTVIEKFQQYGDKTNWSYVLIPEVIALQLKPGNRKTFRVKGKLDDYAIEKVSLIPDGNGNFILPVNSTMRKHLRKNAGATVVVSISVDDEPPPINSELLTCLQDDPAAWENFSVLRRSHQLYFSNWVNSAKTTQTRDKRIAHCVDALSKNFDYGQMIRSLKKQI
jgi:hypothetical protein